MEYYAIEVSLELSSVCLVDGTGKIVREAKVASQPDPTHQAVDAAPRSFAGWADKQPLVANRVM